MKNKQFICILSVILFMSCETYETDSTKANDVFYLRNNNADMPVQVKGNTNSKTFILWLHGGPGGSSYPHKYRNYPALSMLEEKYANVYWDQRCAGNSTGTFNPDDLTISVMLDDLNKLVVLLKEIYGQDISIFLLGHSWGGAFGYAYLTDNLKNQNQFDGYIAISALHNVPLLLEQQKQQINDLANRQIKLGNCISDWETSKEKLNDLDETDVNNFTSLNKLAFAGISLMEKVDSIDAEPSWLEFKRLFDTPNVEMTFVNKTISFNSPLTDELENLNVSSKLQNINIPVLILSGKYDLVVPVSQSEDAFQKTGATKKYHVTFDRSAHCPTISAPEQIVNTIENFIENL